MEMIAYKGYGIEPVPFHLANGNWDMNVFIWKFRDTITARHFFASNMFATKEDAIGHCINFGRQIIDGHVKNCTVSDL